MITAIRDDAHWHELRAKAVGGSEVAALFGLSPFTTAYTLWHEKAGKVPREEFDNQKTNWGKLIEPLVAGELAKHLAAHPEIVVTSSTTGAGVPELRARLAKLAAPPPSR